MRASQKAYGSDKIDFVQSDIKIKVLVSLSLVLLGCRIGEGFGVPPGHVVVNLADCSTMYLLFCCIFIF